MKYFCNVIVIFVLGFVNYLYMVLVFIYICFFLILLSLLFVKNLKNRKFFLLKILYFISVIACIFFLKGYNKIEIRYWRCRLMLRNYYKYLPWLILAAFVSYGGATHYAQTTFDLFYLTAIFMIVYVALLYLHETYLKYKYKDLFIRIMSNSKTDKHP